MCFANAQILPSFKTSIHEKLHKAVTGNKKSLIFNLRSYCQYFQRRQTKPFEGCFIKAVFVFFCKTVPTFHFSYLLHPEGCHRGELCRAALQEDSNGPQRKGLALLLNNPVSAALGRVSGSSLQLPIATFLWWRNVIASSQNLSAPFLVSVIDVNFWVLEDLDVLRKQLGTTWMFTGVHGWHRGVSDLLLFYKQKWSPYFENIIFCLFFRCRALLKELLLIAFWKDEGATFSNPPINFL